MSHYCQSSFSIEAMDLLSALLLPPTPEAPSRLAQERAGKLSRLYQMSPEGIASLLSFAHSNHVVVRAAICCRELLLEANDSVGAHIAEEILGAERARIANAMSHLRMICDAFEEAGLDVTVIKTLDHWPDFGSDIDLYTGANPAHVCELMQRKFRASIALRSWGDRLAGKWNFEIPGLPEPVEIHMCRLGQTGEQVALAANVPARSHVPQFGEHEFRVPSISDRIMISTLQRMYRHFYFRLCDIVDSAELATSGQIDYADLMRSAQRCGIWEGVATYLVLVSDYVKRYRGLAFALPDFVQAAARFDGRVMYCGGSFLRVPILPQSAGLYRSQLTGLLRRGELYSSARLTVLPWLATAAAIGYKLTGSDKGIW